MINLVKRLLVFLMLGSTGFAGDVIAVIKSPSTVYRLKGSNGAFLGQNHAWL